MDCWSFVGNYYLHHIGEGYEPSEEIKKIKQAMLKWKYCQKELELLQTIPGFGPLVSRVFISEVGEITRFPSTKKLSCFAGLVPGLRASGEQSHATSIIKASNSALRYAIVMAAWPAIKNDPQLRARYDRLKARGKSSGKAIVAIAHHLLRIAYVMLTKRAPYRMRALVKELKGEEAPRRGLEPLKLISKDWGPFRPTHHNGLRARIGGCRNQILAQQLKRTVRYIEDFE